VVVATSSNHAPALHLSDFPGPINLLTSHFLYTHAPFPDCPAFESDFDLTTAPTGRKLTLATPYSLEPLRYQHHSLVRISKHSSSAGIRIEGCEVVGNTATRGVFEVELASSERAYVLVENNRFEGNAGMVSGGANAIRLVRIEDEITNNRA